MRIVDIDHYALTGETLLHKAATNHKLLWVILLITLIILSNDYLLLSVVYLSMFSYIIFSKIAKKMVFMLTLYPLLFVVFIILSTSNASIEFVLTIILKVLIASTTMVLLFSTTPYIDIFSRLGRFMPGFLVTTVFLTYRSIYILWTTLENLTRAIRLRGGISVKKPVRSLQVIANALGYLLIKSVETSEKMYEALLLRGYSDRLRYINKNNG